MRRQHITKILQPRASLALAVLTLAVSACRDQGTKVNHPDFRVSQTALSFNACPTQDDQGNPVADVFPAQQTFSIENLGKAPGNLSISIEGDAKDRFEIVPATLVGSIDSGSAADIAVQFTPIASGDAKASLVVDDGDDTTEPVRVTLLGTGSDLAAQPTIRISYEDPETGNFVECLTGFDGSIDNCGPATFTRTFLGQTNDLRFKIENLGCPSLKITDLELAPLNEGDLVQFFIDQPAVLPSSASPLALNLTDGAQAEVVARFEPRDDGTTDGPRWAVFKVRSNAPQSPESLIALYGMANQPAIYATPSFCDFSDANDTCGGTKTPTTGANAIASFRITNGGNTPVTLESVAFRGTTSGRFKIAGTNPTGTTIAAGDSAVLQVEYTDAPIYVTELIDITATDLGQPAGIATVRVSGGVLPKLYTVPPNSQYLDFSDATTSPATKPVQICNAVGAGTLVINRVQVVQGMKFFKVTGAPASGTQVAAGQCVTANIEFTQSVSGGFQFGSLEITSNDPGSPYQLALYSETPKDFIPVAVLEGPNGETSLSVSLTALDPKTLTLHAENSYDPTEAGASTPVSEYQFFLGRKPTNATAASITAPGTTTSIDGQRQTSPQVDLNLDPVAVGEYQIWLTVYDSANQPSASVKMSVFVRD